MQFLYNRVMEILEADKRARDDDGYLYHKIVEGLAPEMLHITVSEYFLHKGDLYKVPNYDSVTRVRRKVQEENPWLRPSDRVKQIRADNEEIYRAFARNEVR